MVDIFFYCCDINHKPFNIENQYAMNLQIAIHMSVKKNMNTFNEIW